MDPGGMDWEGGGVLIEYFSCVSLSHVYHLPSKYRSNFSWETHDHTSKGLKQLAVSNMILRYCMTYHYYSVYFIMSFIFFCFIVKIAPPALHRPCIPHGQAWGGGAPPATPSKSIPVLYNIWQVLFRFETTENSKILEKYKRIWV